MRKRAMCDVFIVDFIALSKALLFPYTWAATRVIVHLKQIEIGAMK